jgi:hypothetical protein
MVEIGHIPPAQNVGHVHLAAGTHDEGANDRKQDQGIHRQRRKTREHPHGHLEGETALF